MLRLKYYELSAEPMKAMITLKEHMAKSAVGNPLLDLLYVRISQLNGCAYCVKKHSSDLRARNETQDRLDSVAGWRVSELFTEKERAALAWAEALTLIADTRDVPDSIYLPLKAHFTDQEISDLLFAVAMMNAFNRLAVGMRQ